MWGISQRALLARRHPHLEDLAALGWLLRDPRVAGVLRTTVDDHRESVRRIDDLVHFE